MAAAREKLEPVLRIGTLVSEARAEIAALHDAPGADDARLDALGDIVDAIAARSAEAADGLLEPTAKHVDTAGNFFKLKQAQEAEAASTRRHKLWSFTTSEQRKGWNADGDYLGV